MKQFTESLNTKLTAAFVLVSVVSILTVAFFSFVAAENSLKERITSHLQNEAKYRAELIKQIWDLRVEQVQFLSYGKIKSILQKSNITVPDQIMNRQELKNIITPLLETSGLYDIQIINRNGKIVYTTNKNQVGTDLSQDPKFIRGTKESFYALQKNPQTDKLMMVILIPVTVNKTGSSDILGVIEVSRDLPLANQITTDRANLGKTGEIYLVNQDRMMITESRFVQNAPFNLKVDTTPVKECFDNGKQVTGIYTDYRAIPVFGASYCSRDNGFVLLAEADVAEVYFPITDLRNQYLIIGSTIILCTGIISFFIARSISRPIARLIPIAESIGRGNLHVEIEESKSKTEIGRFLNSFRMMVFNLHQLIRQIQGLNDQLRQANEEIKLNDKLKDEFISIISHELRTPLVIINGYCEMLKEMGLIGNLNQDQIQSVDRIYQNSHKLKKLIDDIFDVKKLDLGKMRFDKKEIHVHEFMNQVKSDYESLMKEKNIEFVNTTDENFDIVSDADRLSQVFSNLIKNSVDFVPTTGGRIEIQVKRQNNDAIFSVKDNGSGISEEKKKNVFQKFYKGDMSYGRKYGGTGLGLAICKGIVEGLDGKIWFESKEGQGTTFYFIIPLATISDADQS